jgi:hypothetical protein
MGGRDMRNLMMMAVMLSSVATTALAQPVDSEAIFNVWLDCRWSEHIKITSGFGGKSNKTESEYQHKDIYVFSKTNNLLRQYNEKYQQLIPVVGGTVDIRENAITITETDNDHSLDSSNRYMKQWMLYRSNLKISVLGVGLRNR